MSSMSGTLLLVLVVAICTCLIRSGSAEDGAFDVRIHLSTVTRYDAVKDIVNEAYIPADIPDACNPIHLTLLARHGTRAPTEDRIQELDRLADSLPLLLQTANSSIPGWLYGWKSPWHGNTEGGQLLIQGELEHYSIALRLRHRFADLFTDDYDSLVYPIRATQVPRTSASAVAFGMGVFKNKGAFGIEGYRAFSVTTESKQSDILLRFFDACQNFKEYKKSQKPDLEKMKEPVLDEIAMSLSSRYGLNFTTQLVSSLWFLCQQEASLLGITHQACQLFTPHQVELLEWTDDLELFVLRGYGNPLNYDMATPLLNDFYESMESAIKANQEAQPSGSFEKARLLFGHAETLVPFACLLGLFLEAPDYAKIQRKEALQVPPMPPQERAWKGSIMTPFAGNIELVLHSCPAASTTTTSTNYFVQALHNEHPIPIPGCNYTDFCPYEVFKENVLLPELKNDFNSVCSALKSPKEKPSASSISEKNEL